MKKTNKMNIFAVSAVIASLFLSAAAYAEIPAEDEVIAPAVAVSPPYNPDMEDSLPDVEDSLPQPNSSVGSTKAPFEGLPMGTGSVEDLCKYWETNGYPDYVSYAAELGIASYDVATAAETVYKSWTIGVVNATEAQKQEIISLISSDYSVDFESASYTHAYREERAEKIRQSYPKAIVELSDASESIYMYNNGYTDEEWKDIVSAYENGIIVNGGNYDMDGGFYNGAPEIGINEFAIGSLDDLKATDAVNAVGIDAAAPTVGIDNNVNGAAPEAAPAIGIENGKDVDLAPPVNEADGISGGSEGFSGGNQEAAMLPAVQKKANPIYMWIFISAVSVITAGTAAFVILRKAKKSALVTTEGNTVAAGASPTKAEIVKAVKDSQIEPDNNAFQKIMDEINK